MTGRTSRRQSPCFRQKSVKIFYSFDFGAELDFFNSLIQNE